jgi:tetratricopeptide (TPR) repeat protein
VHARSVRPSAHGSRREDILFRSPGCGHEPEQPGVIYRELGRYSEAERLYRRSLAIAETSHGSDTSKTVTTMSNLGRVCADQGRNGEASPTHVYGAEGTKGRRPDRHTSAA